MKPITLFLSYAYEDESLRKKLEKHLSLLQRQGFLSTWYDRQIHAGENRAEVIERQLEQASIILLLISPDFLASDYCYSIEMFQALERHAVRKACVIPVMLRPVDCLGAPFAHLKCLPHNKEPVTTWSNQDNAFLDIVQGLRETIEQSERSVYQPLSTIKIPSAPLNLVTPKKTTSESKSKGPISRRTFLIKATCAIIVGGGGVVGASEFIITHQQSPYTRLTMTSKATGTPATPTTSTSTSTIDTATPTTTTATSVVTPQKLFSYRHSDVIETVAWSPDGQRIASGSDDTTVQVRSTSDGNSLVTYKGHSKVVWAVAWSPDGQRIASGSGYDGKDNTVQVWNASSGSNVFIYMGHFKDVWAVAWSPDGQRIASGSADKTVQVWNAIDGSPLFTYTGHTNAVRAVVWSPDGQRIASGSGDETVQVWNASTGSLVSTYTGHSLSVFSIAWSPDGQKIASGSADKTVQVWNASTGSPLFTYTGHTDEVHSVAWSPNGQRIASGSNDMTVQVWNASTGSSQFIHQDPKYPYWVRAVAWSPDGQRIASGYYDGISGTHNGTVQVWDMIGI